MFNSMRNRLILSHILPLLVILPILGIGLIYVLENEIFLPALSNEVENDAWLIARLVALEEDAWTNPDRFNEIIRLQAPIQNGYVRLFDPVGRLVASNEPEDQGQVGQLLAPGLPQLAGSSREVIRQVQYSSPRAAELIDVIVPVSGKDGELKGFVWVDYPFASVVDEIYQIRFLIISVLALGLIFGSGIGSLLAVSISTPIRRVTSAIEALTRSTQLELLDISGPDEIQSLLQSVNTLVIRLRETEKSRRQLLANLVHELGRPLGAIRSAITALRQGAAKDPLLYQDLLAGLEDETLRLQYLLNDLSGLHEHILGSFELDRHPMDLEQWLPTVLQTWQAAALEKGIQWEYTVSGPLPTICGDPARLAQVVGNLVNNAVKFTPPGGRISISAGATSQHIKIAIRDTGPGLQPGEIDQVFQPFFRGAYGRRFPQGMGLGLSIARDLAEAHAGSVEVESTPGQGSCFTLWLPLQPPDL